MKNVLMTALLLTVPASLPAMPTAAELPGADSPQAVTAKMQTASAAGDHGAVMNLVEPATRRRLAAARIWGAYLLISIAETNAAANASIAAQESYFTAEERADAAQESGKEAKRAAELRQRLASVLSGFGITMDLAPATPVKDIPGGEALEALVENVDQGKLIAALDAFQATIHPPLPRPETQTLPEVTDYRIAGDSATARTGDRVLDFVRVDGRWYSLPPPLPKITEPSKIP